MVSMGISFMKHVLYLFDKLEEKQRADARDRKEKNIRWMNRVSSILS